MSDIMWVVMTLTISGGRADGRNWPDRLDYAHPLDVPRDEGEHLVAVGQAVEVAAPDWAAGAPVPGPASATPAPVSEAAPTAAGPVPAPADDSPDTAAVADAPEPPKPADSKQAWVDYALSRNELPPETVGVMTKADLMSRFGGRL